jgi:DtxR family Mn-dependent transcriptional regulator
MTAKRTRRLSSSLEDYLEAICHIVERKGAARVKDIAQSVGVRSSSVTGALRTLSGRGLIHYAPYDVVTLTDDGKTAADRIIRRHRVLHDFFAQVLGVSEKEADAAACGMEHAISSKVLERLTDFLEFTKSVPGAGPQLVELFKSYRGVE